MISFEEFKKLDLRTARILDVKEHPDADKLYLIQIDVGDEKKQIVAGVRGNYSIEALKGRDIVVINNLEPVTIRGEESRGMLLAASAEQGPIILIPENGVPPGTSIR